MSYLFTSESVSEGHPDKVADQISDALLDQFLAYDPEAHCAIETFDTTGQVVIMGEVRSSEYIDLQTIARNTINAIGYTKAEYQFDGNSCGILTAIHEQSDDINRGVSRVEEENQGAGDQGMMFGYACNDTEELLPTAQVILQRLSKEYYKLTKRFGDYLADGKAQITGYYDDDFKLIKIKTFTISYQNSEINREFTDTILKGIVKEICEDYNIEIEEFLINPTGKFLIGGFEGDAGLTGRKIVVDTYHSFANVGGGAFSGKDYTKVDRSGAYKARQLAIRYLKEHNLKWCEVQISYAIGKAEPLAIYIDSDKGNFEPTLELYEECKPLNIVADLDLLNCNYKKTAMFGHFGNKDFTWEN